MPAAEQGIAADTAAATEEKPRELSINELEKLDDLLPVARDFNLHLHPARSRHHHILDIARAAVGQGANVTAEGFLDQVAVTGKDAEPEFGQELLFNFLKIDQVTRDGIGVEKFGSGKDLAQALAESAFTCGDSARDSYRRHFKQS